MTNREGSSTAASVARPRPSHRPVSCTAFTPRGSPARASSSADRAEARPARAASASAETRSSQQPVFPQGQGSPAGSTVMCPYSPAMPCAPMSTAPSCTSAPPMPVPMATMTIRSGPPGQAGFPGGRPASPSRASAQAAASASLTTEGSGTVPGAGRTAPSGAAGSPVTSDRAAPRSAGSGRWRHPIRCGLKTAVPLSGSIQAAAERPHTTGSPGQMASSVPNSSRAVRAHRAVRPAPSASRW